MIGDELDSGNIITREYLNIAEFENLEIKNNLSLEWKLLNVEYFLRTFSNYAK